IVLDSQGQRGWATGKSAATASRPSQALSMLCGIPGLANRRHLGIRQLFAATRKPIGLFLDPIPAVPEGSAQRKTPDEIGWFPEFARRIRCVF
ncbi:MAG: hypothetical protein N2C14_21075, partial [Planctomycetales bacterium]